MKRRPRAATFPGDQRSLGAGAFEVVCLCVSDGNRCPSLQKNSPLSNLQPSRCKSSVLFYYLGEYTCASNRSLKDGFKIRTTDGPRKE